MADELPLHYAYPIYVLAAIVTGVSLMRGTTWLRRVPLDAAGRLRNAAMLVAACIWLLSTTVEQVIPGTTVSLLRDVAIAFSMLAWVIVLVGADRIARRFAKQE